MEFAVMISCMTYNHAHYIKDALDGFCKQNTNFPFVVVLVDDASTDGEQGVIKDYLKEHFDLDDLTTFKSDETENYSFFFLKHKENLNCFFATYLLKYNHYGKKDKQKYYREYSNSVKYISLCEGDDYWIIPDKLQKQYDFLESNSDFSMCYSGFQTVDKDGKYIFRANYEKAMSMSRTGDILNDLLVTNFILTCTTFFRNGTVSLETLNGFKYHHDYTLFLTASTYGKCKYFPEKMSAYRQVPTGAMATQRDWVRKAFHETRLFFYNGICNGTIPLKSKVTHQIKKTIATYCFFEESDEFKHRYFEILKQNKILWYFIPILSLKKAVASFLNLFKHNK